MATHPAQVLQHLRRSLLASDGGSLTDGQLLECFVEGSDEQAFAALVRRHGPMVWGVCRRHLIRPEDAEDAFQATFLVLARRAGSVRPREKVGNWLHGVAWQTTRKIRAMALRRQIRERQLADLPEPAAPEPQPGDDLRRLLDQEIRRLPDKYRTPLLLCDLEQRTRKEVAQQLGVPEGTVAGRLARARSLLGRRLVRRGVTLGGVTLDVALAQEAVAAVVPNTLIAPTLEAARLLVAGQPLAADLVSVQARTLMEGMVQSMLASEFKNMAIVVFLVGLIGLGAARIGFRATFADEGPLQQQRQDATKPTPETKPRSAKLEANPGENPGLKTTALDQEVKKRLEMPQTMRFEERPLKEVLDELRALSGLNIVVDNLAMQNEGVSLSAPVSLQLEAVPLKTILKHVLHNAGRLEYTVQDGILVIAPAVYRQVTWRIYPVGDLLGGEPEKEAEKLVKIITRSINPGSWQVPGESSGPGAIDYFPGTQSLIVSQAAEVQDEVQIFLETLRKQRKSPPSM